jgi:hypothetical protein
MVWNGYECGKHKYNDNFKATAPSTDYDRSKTAARDLEYFTI